MGGSVTPDRPPVGSNHRTGRPLRNSLPPAGRRRQTALVPPRNVDRLTREYGPNTWDVYEVLDRSLDPRGPDLLHELAGRYLHRGDVVLDAGCRDGEHLIKL